jgi:hypothetical protein
MIITAHMHSCSTDVFVQVASSGVLQRWTRRVLRLPPSTRRLPSLRSFAFSLPGSVDRAPLSSNAGAHRMPCDRLQGREMISCLRSSLAVIEPPHALVDSVYPVPLLPRKDLVFAIEFRRCLQSEVGRFGNGRCRPRRMNAADV